MINKKERLARIIKLSVINLDDSDAELKDETGSINLFKSIQSKLTDEQVYDGLDKDHIKYIVDKESSK